MTNLEWIRTLSEEEFADWLYDEWLHHLQYRWSSSRGGLIIWLKDRKTENSSEKPNNSTISKMEQVDEPTEITYQNCSDALLKMWMDNVLTDAEYNRIMDKLNNAQRKDEPQTERSE